MAEIILALDVTSATEAERLLDRLPALRWVKVGSILMTREGAPLIRSLLRRGLRVFLDLKWHDIPNTVAGAVTAAADLGVSLATVHALGGKDMMIAAAQARGGELKLVGVTVLTSHDDTSYGEATGRVAVDTAAEVGRLSRTAIESGLDGVVCSPREILMLRESLGPRPLIVVPGIRRPDDPAQDQKRIATPASAVAAGATHLVVGRPILEAPNPEAALHALLDVT